MFELLIKCFSNETIIKLLLVIELHVSYTYASVQCFLARTQHKLAGNQRRRCNTHPNGGCPTDMLSGPSSGWVCKMANFFRRYQGVTTGYTAILLVRKSLPLELLFQFMLATPAYCFVPGRQSIATKIFEDGGSVLIGGINLFYRYGRLTSSKLLKLDVIPFILASQSQVGHEIANITRQIDEDTLAEENCAHLRARHLRNILRLPADPKQPSKKQTIRPHRTLEAHARLRHWFASASVITVCLALPLASIGAAMSLNNLFSGRKYIERYLGCSPTLERQANTTQVSDWRLNLSWHRLISLPFDLADNQVIWIDTLMVYVFLLTPVLLANEDLVQYVRLTRTRLKEVHGLLILKSIKEHRDQSIARELKMLDKLIPECIRYIEDLSDQIEKVDVLMSLVLQTAVTIWLSTSSFVFYHGVFKNGRVTPMILFEQFGLFMLFTMLSIFLLRLNRAGGQFYPLIVSIMAESAPNRKNFQNSWSNR